VFAFENYRVAQEFCIRCISLMLVD